MEILSPAVFLVKEDSHMYKLIHDFYYILP